MDDFQSVQKRESMLHEKLLARFVRERSQGRVEQANAVYVAPAED